MRLLFKIVMLVLAASLWPVVASAQSAENGGVIIPLYAERDVPPLDVPETWVKLDETGETYVFNVSDPTLELFLPPSGQANGAAVIVAPGGGFVGLGYDHGGAAVARRLTQHGVAAFVLKYRTIPSAGDPVRLPDVHIREMETLMARAQSGEPLEAPPFAGEPRAVEDGARAMAIVRRRAAEWGVDPRRVGVLGFSAGAFLAVNLAIGDRSTRPDFVALLYGGLRTPVPADAPPAFIAAAADDAFLPDDSIQLYAAWRDAGAPAELHVYEQGGHGFDLTPRGATSDNWFDALIRWMEARGLAGRAEDGRDRLSVDP